MYGLTYEGCLGGIEADLTEKRLICYKGFSGFLATDCKNRNLRDRLDYKFDYKLQNSDCSEPGFFLVDNKLQTAISRIFCAARGHVH